MKVRITKVTSDACWYDSLIGKEYEVNSEMNDRYLVRNKSFGILKSDCEIINEEEGEVKMKIGDYVIPLLHNPDKEPAVITKISEGLGYQVKYSGGTRFWYQEDQLSPKEEVKEYEAAQDIFDVSKEEIKIFITDDKKQFWYFYSDVNELHISITKLPELLSKGIIREKKSKAEEIVFNVCQKYWESNADDYRVKRLSDILFSELNKAGVK